MTVDYTELRRLAQAATPGPWKQAPWHSTDVLPVGWAEEWGDLPSRGPFAITTTTELADAAFIAAANPSVILSLLDELDRLDDVVTRCDAEVNRLIAESIDHRCECPHVATSDEGTSQGTLAEAREPWITCDEEGNRYRVEPHYRCVFDLGADICDHAGWGCGTYARLVPIDPQETTE